MSDCQGCAAPECQELSDLRARVEELEGALKGARVSYQEALRRVLEYIGHGYVAGHSTFHDDALPAIAAAVRSNELAVIQMNSIADDRDLLKVRLDAMTQQGQIEIAKLKAEADEAYSKGHDTLEFAIAEAIGEEADSVEVEVVRIVANIKRQRDEAYVRCERAEAGLEEALDIVDIVAPECDRAGPLRELLTVDRELVSVTPRKELEADLHERKQAHGESEIKRINLEQRFERATMDKREAQAILARCDQGTQNCHRCPALGCDDNRTVEA